ncbi:hypothetical protein GA830_09755 [Mesorhizobium sp. NBSH29]|uniref:hypothetical protein n=1 Tax=Mesorhizobium sp. NBSH29 TaxID=2654249 RepID=UPI0018966EF5|nr:hypothetical protein [Mesorhizobium sp. NBSH29]QPC86986.1 hypothetical protein GA830_09755 [Mesorhizobium sp. NBSH29]
MHAFIKFLHIFALMLGAGAGFGQLIIARRLRAADGQLKPELMALRPIFARLGLAGIVLIWLTGLWLYLGFYAGSNLGAAFHIKLLLATALLAISITGAVVMARAKAGSRPPAWLPTLGMASGPLLLLAVALAVYIFN